ncbi:MAG: DMT family transporter [Chloroflexota bacterium]
MTSARMPFGGVVMGVAVAVAIGVGIAIAAQVAIVGQASRVIHPLTVSLALQASGLLVGISWAVWSRTWPQLTGVVTQWWWLPLGALGLGVVAALGFSASRLGVNSTLAMVIASQLFAGLLLDHFSGRIEMGLSQSFGASLLVVGVLVLTAPWR